MISQAPVITPPTDVIVRGIGLKDTTSPAVTPAINNIGPSQKKSDQGNLDRIDNFMEKRLKKIRIQAKNAGTVRHQWTGL